MENNLLLKGIMPALVSPVNEDYTVREDVTRRLVEWQLSKGCTGFYVCGGTGEGVVMQPDARKKMAEIVVDQTAGRGKVVVHIGAIDLKTTIELAQHAEKIGADVISSVPPLYYNYSFEEKYNYYKAISDNCGLPILMYASPMAGAPMTVEQIDRVMDIPTMIGLKWTNPDMYALQQIKTLRGGNITVINGPDEMLSCGLIMGADGGIGSTYNCMPGTVVSLYNAFQAGNIPEVQRIQRKMNAFIKLMIKHTVIPACKATLEYQGFDVGNATYPMKALSAEEKAVLYAELKEIGFDEYE
ncbi:MAG: dihydrodipicolinate synthase family protein [Oscillospiraceae bacterium]|nr:dihydrodipicolinate synthase family protein [Oscillospiraceae bacterium]